jgi:hypothetical protein
MRSSTSRRHRDLVGHPAGDRVAGGARGSRFDVGREHMTAHRAQTDRPGLGVATPDAQDAAEAFADGLQRGHDRADAGILNRQFAQDIVWGSPYGALVHGYDELHAIHARFQQHQDDAPAIRYEVRNVLALNADVVVAHIARRVLDDEGEPRPLSADPDEPFSEMAMFVLVRRDGEWWLAAGQHTPMRPGGALPAT